MHLWFYPYMHILIFICVGSFFTSKSWKLPYDPEGVSATENSIKKITKSLAVALVFLCAFVHGFGAKGCGFSADTVVAALEDRNGGGDDHDDDEDNDDNIGGEIDFF